MGPGRARAHVVAPSAYARSPCLADVAPSADQYVQARPKQKPAKAPTKKDDDLGAWPRSEAAFLSYFGGEQVHQAADVTSPSGRQAEEMHSRRHHHFTQPEHAVRLAQSPLQQHQYPQLEHTGRVAHSPQQQQHSEPHRPPTTPLLRHSMPVPAAYSPQPRPETASALLGNASDLQRPAGRPRTVRSKTEDVEAGSLRPSGAAQVVSSRPGQHPSSPFADEAVAAR